MILYYFLISVMNLSISLGWTTYAARMQCTLVLCRKHSHLFGSLVLITVKGFALNLPSRHHVSNYRTFVTISNVWNRKSILAHVQQSGRHYFSRFVDGKTLGENTRKSPPWRMMFFGTDNYSLVHLKAVHLNRWAISWEVSDLSHLSHVEDLSPLILSLVYLTFFQW